MFTGMKKLFGTKVREEKGASAVEYALIAGLIAVVIIGTVTLLGTTIQATFQSIVDSLS